MPPETRDSVEIAGSNVFNIAAKKALIEVGFDGDVLEAGNDTTAIELISKFGERIGVLLVSGGIDSFGSVSSISPAADVCEAAHNAGIPHIRLATCLRISDDARSRLANDGVVLFERGGLDDDVAPLVEYLRKVLNEVVEPAAQ